MSAVLTIAFPVFAIILAGLFAGRAKIAEAADAQALNRFVFFFAMPAALFSLTSRADPPAGDDIKMALCYLTAALAVMAAAYALGRRFFALSEQEAGAQALTSVLGNAVFLGLPIVLSLDGWIEHYVVLMLMEGVFVIAIGAALIGPREAGMQDGAGRTSILQKLGAPLARSLKNPLVAAMLAGIGVALLREATGLALPVPIAAFFELLGRAGGPAALFSMGLFLGARKFPAMGEIAGKVGVIVLFKMVALPVLTLTGMALVGVSDPALIGPAALFVLVPSGIGCYVMASQHNVYVAETVSAIAVTTLISILTVSIVLAIFAR